MPTPSSRTHEASSADPQRTVGQSRQLHNKNLAVRRRRAVNAAPPATSPILTRKEDEVLATWRSQRGLSELRLRLTRHGLQVRQCNWHSDGNVVEEAFTLHSRAQFETWHAAADTKFEYAVAHDEIRRFAHAKLPD